MGGVDDRSPQWSALEADRAHARPAHERAELASPCRRDSTAWAASPRAASQPPRAKSSTVAPPISTVVAPAPTPLAAAEDELVSSFLGRRVTRSIDAIHDIIAPSDLDAVGLHLHVRALGHDPDRDLRAVGRTEGPPNAASMAAPCAHRRHGRRDCFARVGRGDADVLESRATAATNATVGTRANPAPPTGDISSVATIPTLIPTPHSSVDAIEPAVDSQSAAAQELVTVTHAAADPDWAVVVERCQPVPLASMSTAERTNCGVAACKRSERVLAIHYRNSVRNAAPIEQACRESNVALPSRRTREDSCEHNPLRCRQ